jgi:hypothetical protein
MATISTTDYLLDQAKRRLTPSFNNFPGMAAVEQRLLNTNWAPRKLADPPPGSGLKPVMGDRGLPVLGHIIEMLRGGPDYLLFLYQNKGPVIFGDSPVLPGVAALGPDAAQVIYSNRNKDYSQQGWVPVIGPFFNRGLMLLDFEEHMFHRRIMQEAFVRSRLVSYVEKMDQVVSQTIANDWVANDARFLLYPAMKELTLDIASMVFMGHEPGTDHDLVTKVNKAFAVTTRAGNAIIRTPVPPFTWWRGLKAREYLENYFRERVKEQRAKQGDDLLSVLCHTEDDDGNKFSDGARHRTAGLLHPQGHQRHRVPRNESPAARILDGPTEIRPGAVHRAAQRAQTAPLRVHTVRRGRAQVHRDGVRAVGDQDDSSSPAAQVSARAAPPGLQGRVGLRRHAGAEGRHANCVAPALNSCRLGGVFSAAQPISARDQRAQRRLRRILG